MTHRQIVRRIRMISCGRKCIHSSGKEETTGKCGVGKVISKVDTNVWLLQCATI